MPSYVLVCTECDHPLDEVICTIADREEMACPECAGDLTNDYSRMETSNFSLKGDNWPGKMVKLENDIVRGGV